MTAFAKYENIIVQKLEKPRVCELKKFKIQFCKQTLKESLEFDNQTQGFLLNASAVFETADTPNFAISILPQNTAEVQ